MSQRVVDGCFQVTDLLAGIVALSFENVAVEIALLHELAQGVGELDFAPRPPSRFFENRKLVAPLE